LFICTWNLQILSNVLAFFILSVLVLGLLYDLAQVKSTLCACSLHLSVCLSRLSAKIVLPPVSCCINFILPYNNLRLAKQTFIKFGMAVMLLEVV
jgi:hypothetical protein